MNNSSNCPTCARLAAEAEILARLDWWAAQAKREELETHRRECEIASCNNA